MHDMKFVKTKHLSLLVSQTVSDCKSPVNCRYCGKRHNSLLHVFIQLNEPVHSDLVSLNCHVLKCLSHSFQFYSKC